MSDLIKREDVIKVIHDYFKEYLDYNETENDEETYSRNVCVILSENKELCTTIKKLPTVEAKPVVHGKWHVQDNTFIKFKCSNCKAKNLTMKSNFCPNCGADMRNEVE